MPGWRWWFAAGVVLLLLALLPPLINANIYQRQIARSMSLSLGRPVHLDNVSLHLLPVPGLTLSNLVVSEDPAFGSEPTIRANTVEATLRLGSLWRHRVEFSTVRFVEPSVNLVRNAEGRWNLADVLLHASHVTTAPTVQRRAGPAPRFPYIEATGGRVNVKLGEEKLPFSLTEAAFALWQPSPHQWRVRLRGQPDRTDANMTEPGVLRVEGDLLQATAQQDVRVDLHANWHDAPLGQASLLLLGADMGWRGSLNLEASLTGTLDQAHIASKLTLDSLRRSEFAPAHPLDLQIVCAAGFTLETVTVRQLACTLPDNAPEPMTLDVPALDLQHPEQAVGSLRASAVPTHWGLLWAALFSPRIPTDLHSPGTFDLQLTHGVAGQSEPQTPGKAQGATAGTTASTGRATAGRATVRRISRRLQPVSPVGVSGTAWSGSLQLNLPPPERASSLSPVGPANPAAPAPVAMPEQGMALLFVYPPAEQDATAGARTLLRLQPVTLHPEGSSGILLEGAVSTAGYNFSVSGTVDRSVLLAPTRYLPQLGDDVEAVLPPVQAGQGLPKVNFTCNANWGTAQLCTEIQTAPAKGKSPAGAGSLSRRPRQP